MVHKYVKQVPQRMYESDPICAERLTRTIRSFRAVGFDYSPDDYIARRKDQIEEENQIFQREYGPSCVRTKLIGMTRVALPSKNMWENDEGVLDKDHKVKSALVVRIQFEILNKEALEKNNISVLIDHRAAQYTYLVGRIEKPELAPVYVNGKLSAYKIINFNHVYFLEDSPTNIKKYLKKYGNPQKLFSVGIANQVGQSIYRNDQVYTVLNEDEFINEPIELLVESNKKGLLGEKAGGVKTLLEWKAVEKKMLEGRVASEIELSKITKEDILSILQRKSQQAKK